MIRKVQNSNSNPLTPNNVIRELSNAILRSGRFQIGNKNDASRLAKAFNTFVFLISHYKKDSKLYTEKTEMRYFENCKKVFADTSCLNAELEKLEVTGTSMDKEEKLNFRCNLRLSILSGIKEKTETEKIETETLRMLANPSNLFSNGSSYSTQIQMWFVFILTLLLMMSGNS